MAGIRPFVLDALPATLVPSAMYFIKDDLHPDKFKLYLANSAGTAVKRLPTTEDIEQEIADAIATLNTIDFAADITERDAKNYTVNTLVYVQDASGDTSVDSGAAMYFYRESTDTYLKTFEGESMDLQLTWAALTGKPVSTPSEIDDAVDATHAHLNFPALNKISDTGGLFTYDGVVIDTRIGLGAPPEW